MAELVLWTDKLQTGEGEVLGIITDSKGVSKIGYLQASIISASSRP